VGGVRRAPAAASARRAVTSPSRRGSTTWASGSPKRTLYCAGVGHGPDGRLVTAGGRVLAVTGMGATIEDARRAAYDGVGRLSWPGRHCRSDIAAVRESAQ